MFYQDLKLNPVDLQNILFTKFGMINKERIIWKNIQVQNFQIKIKRKKNKANLQIKLKNQKKVRRVSSKNPKDKPVVDALNEKILPKLADTGIDSKVSSNWGADGKMHVRISNRDYNPLDEEVRIPEFTYDPKTNSFSVDGYGMPAEIKKLEGKKLKPEQLNEVVDLAVKYAEKEKKEANDKGFVNRVDLIDSRGKDPIEFYKSKIEQWSRKPYTEEEIQNQKDRREANRMREFNYVRDDSLKIWQEKLKIAEKLKK